jgi:hypothetical protein
MLSESELKQMARQSESEQIEKKQSRPSASEVRIALVAFANSVGSNECAVLFIGIGPRGETVGVKDADGDQREIRRIAEHECYPPIECHFRVLQIDGKEIIAVIIPHSRRTPHFTGHSYIRKGSESKRSSEEQMEKLIASRNDKASRLLQMLGEKILIELRPPKPWVELAGLPRIELRQYTVSGCDAHSVTIEDRLVARRITEPLSQVDLLPTNENGCTLKLLIRNPDHAQY